MSSFNVLNRTTLEYVITKAATETIENARKAKVCDVGSGATRRRCLYHRIRAPSGWVRIRMCSRSRTPLSDVRILKIINLTKILNVPYF